MNDVIRRFIIDKNIDYFKKYFDFIVSTIKQDEDIINQKEIMANKAVVEKRVTRNDVDDYLVCLFENHEQMEQMMYRSFVIGIFAFMKEQNKKQHIEETNKFYNEFKIAEKVRNATVHDNKITNNHKQKVKDFSEMHSDFLKINELGEIIKIEPEYAKSLINLSQNIKD